MGDRTRKIGPRISTISYPEIHDGFERQELRLRRTLKAKGQHGGIGKSHILDAALAYLLTRTEAEQARILIEGRRIVDLLEELPLDGQGEPCMPGTYGSVEAGGTGGDVPGRGGRGKKLSKPSAHPDPAFVLGTRPLGTKKR